MAIKEDKVTSIPEITLQDRRLTEEEIIEMKLETGIKQTNILKVSITLSRIQQLVEDLISTTTGLKTMILMGQSSSIKAKLILRIIPLPREVHKIIIITIKMVFLQPSIVTRRRC